MKRSNLLCLSLFLLFIHGLVAQSEWKTLKTGAGGWLTGMHIHPSGDPIFTRSDVGSAYRWSSSTEDWTNIATSENIPAADVYWNNFSGVLSIVSAPSDNTIAYMAYVDNVYRSTNKGDTWERTNIPEIEMRSNDDNSKLSGERLSVDPVNSDVVYFGSIEDGLWVTENGGTNWSQITAIPNGAIGRGIRQIIFDANSGTTGGKTNRIYAFVDEAGVYKSEDAGTSWSLIPFAATSPWFYDAEIATDGSIYIVGENSDYTPFGVYQYDGNNWTQVFTEDLSIAMGELAVDPFDANRIFVFSYGFTDTYRSENVNSTNPNWDYLGFDKTSSGIPWLSWTYSNWFSIGEVVMDPVVQDKIWMADGVGSWVTSDVNDAQMTWDEKSVGQEHLVSNDIVALPNDKVVTAHWDRPIFYHNDFDIYPTIHQPSSRFSSSWDIDVSPTDNDYVVAIIEDHRYCCYDEDTRSSGYSEDGGQTWTKFATMPNPGATNSQYGMIAVAAADNDNLVWLPVGNEMPYYTLDRGDTWAQVALPGASSSCCLAANYFKRRALTADRVLDGTFYIYDFGNGSIFKTSDGGATWVKYNEVTPAYAYNVKLTSVPGQAGHLLYAKGPEEAIGLIGPLSRSRDGGQTWTDFENTNEVLNVTLGKAAEGMDYPTIFIYGRVDGVLGYWMSSDEGETWTQVGSYPLGIYDWPAVMEGDMNVYGRLYVGFGGNGFVYHNLEEALPVSFLDPLWGFARDGKNYLEWTTAEELNVSHFEIQRSGDGSDWDKVGRVPSSGNVMTTTEYEFTDRVPLAGENYYRLKVLDLDNSYKYSNTINIGSNALSGFEISPNPTTEALLLQTTIGQGEIEILDLNGSLVLQQAILSNNKIDISDLAKGVYIIRLSDQSGDSASKKLIKI